MLTGLFLALWGTITLYGYWGNWPPDLSGFYMAGHMFATGQYDLVFAAPEGFFGPRVESWIAEFEAIGVEEQQQFFAYVYPPIWAALVSPLTQIMSPETFFNLVYVINISMLAGCVVCAYRILSPSLRMPFFAAILCLIMTFSMIAVTALVHNQIQIMVTSCILLAFERYTAGKMMQAGLILSIAACVKITPALLGVIFLLDREYRAIAGAMIGGLVIVALSFLIAGPELHWVFLERVATISERVAVMRVNYNLENVLYHLSSLVTGTPFPKVEGLENFGTLEPEWISVTTKAALLVSLAFVLWHTSALGQRDRTATRLFGLLLVTTLMAPLGWNHHYLPVMFLAPIVLNYMPAARAFVILAVFALATSVLVSAALTNFDAWFHWQALLGTVAIIALFVVVFAAARRGQLVTGIQSSTSPVSVVGLNR